MDFSCLFTVVVLPACFLFGRSIDCLCSSCRLIDSLFSQAIVYALLLARSASVRQLFMLFYSPVLLQSVDCFCSSRRLIAYLLASFALIRRLFLLFLSPVPFQSVDCLCSSRLLIASLLASFTLVRRLLLLFSLMDLGRVRQKMTCKNCERINAVKTVNSYGFKNVGTP